MRHQLVISIYVPHDEGLLLILLFFLNVYLDFLPHDVIHEALQFFHVYVPNEQAPRDVLLALFLDVKFQDFHASRYDCLGDALHV